MKAFVRVTNEQAYEKLESVIRRFLQTERKSRIKHSNYGRVKAFWSTIQVLTD